MEQPNNVALLKDEIATYEEKVRLEEEHIARIKSRIEREVRERDNVFHRYMPDRQKKRELLKRYDEKIHFIQLDRHFAKQDLKMYQERLTALKERLQALAPDTASSQEISSP